MKYQHFQLTSCQQSLQTCIELVIDATNTIELLENKIEKKQGEMENMEEQLIETQTELSLQRLDTYKDEKFLTGSDDDELNRNDDLQLMGTNKIFCDSSTQCEIIPQRRDACDSEKRVMQESYVDSVTIYRHIILKLEEKLKHYELSALAFDEVDLKKNRWAIDMKYQRVYPPAKKCNTVVIRGLVQH